MFMSLSSTTRTRAPVSVIAYIGPFTGGLLASGKNFGSNSTLGALRSCSALSGVAFFWPRWGVPCRTSPAGGGGAGLEDVDAVTRRDGIAGRTRLELRHARFELRREHARAERPEDAAALGTAGILR